jgi:Uma2 family endonuclease
MTATAREPELLTAEQFIELPEPGEYRLELARGLVVREPGPGEQHGSVLVKLAAELYAWVASRGLGRVFSDVAIVTRRSPDSVRRPDLAFVTRARMTAYPSVRHLEYVPDLCLEILSPSNRATDIQEKVLEYLDAGARLIWVIDPVGRTAMEYRSLKQIRLLSGGDSLRGYDVLPDFELVLPDLLAV